MNARAEDRAQELARAMTFHFTPFVVFLVALGAWSSGFRGEALAALVMVLITAGANYAVLELMRRQPGKLRFIRSLRVAVNYLFNIPIVYLLWPYWPPAWMLLLPSIVAVALFEDRRTTAGTAALFSFVLLFVHYARGMASAATAAETVMYIASLWTVGLLINRVAGEPATS
jgi:hypothetical protein